MAQTPAWYPGKSQAAIDDEADTIEVLALSDETSSLVLQSWITCPACGFRREETMPLDHCVSFYSCQHCGRVLQPIYGDCCVFCSYGSVMCPSEQRRELQDASRSIRRYVGDLRAVTEPDE